jgi:hypothetical protein
VPVGAALLALHVVADLVVSWLTFRRGTDLPARPDHGEAI